MTKQQVDKQQVDKQQVELEIIRDLIAQVKAMSERVSLLCKEIKRETSRGNR